MEHDSTLSTYDRLMGLLDGLPGGLKTKPTTKRSVVPVVGITQTFIVQTYRQHENDRKLGGDTVFLEYFGPEGVIRLALPPVVSETIARQREALNRGARKRGARQAIETKRERGIDPAAALRRAK